MSSLVRCNLQGQTKLTQLGFQIEIPMDLGISRKKDIQLLSLKHIDRESVEQKEGRILFLLA